MNKRIGILIFILLSASLWAQSSQGNRGGSGGGCIAQVANLSVKCGTVKSTIASVTDGSSTSDCTTGGGSNPVACIYTGSAWAFAGSSASNPAFSAVTAGTNTAALVIGTGGSLGVTGSGTNTATGLTGSPSITVNGITATTYNGGAFSGTFSGAPTFSGNIAFSGTPTFSNTLALNTSGNAATATTAGKWTTARNLAGNSVDGSANVAFTNKVILQGTTDAGFSSAQFLGALATGLVKNTTTTGVLSIGAAADVYGLFTGCTGSSGFFLEDGGTCAAPSGSGTVSGQTQYGIPIPATATTITSSTTPGSNRGTYLVGRSNTSQGTATTTVEIQQGDCSGGGSTVSGSTSTYTVLYSDVTGCTVTHDRAASAGVTVTIPTPTTLNNPAPIFVWQNDSASTDTLTPTTFTIHLGSAAAGATLNVPANTVCAVSLDPFNASVWKANCHPNVTTVAPILVANGTSAMGTGGITTGTCATVVTTTATGALTSDNLVANPTVDPTGVTGYAPSASGSLYIQAYLTSGNANFKVCNNTSGTITPSALTMQWRVIR